jgi:ProP effector
MNYKGHRRRSDIIRAMLVEEFPRCFAGKGEEKRPLAVSVGPALQVMKPEFGRHALAAALEDYCSGPTYLRNCVAGAGRINLNGEPEGFVTANQAEFSAHKMKLFTDSPARVEMAKVAAQ